MKNIVLLGSTGSIGENAVQVVRNLSDELRVVGVAAGSSTVRLAEQASVLGCRWACIADASALPDLSGRLPDGCRAVCSSDLCELVAAPDVDLVLCSIVGTAGLQPVLAAIRAGKDIALASKEVLVMAGELVMAAAERHGVRLLPVDSEHCALFQCLDGRDPGTVQRLILTASGGPFRTLSRPELATVTPAQALAHPTWDMGSKITVDSATLMNKALELIEARWLFGVAQDRIDVVVHPQSIIHSMVEFADASILAQMGNPDMRLPIQYCLTYPSRSPSLITPMDFSQAWTLTFEPPDQDRFPAVRLARQALMAGGTMPAVLNAANEIAVARFCDGRLTFTGIAETVERVMACHTPGSASDLGGILAADAWARRKADEICAAAQ